MKTFWKPGVDSQNVCSVLTLSFAGCMALSKSLSLLELQSHHLLNGKANQPPSVHRTRLCTHHKCKWQSVQTWQEVPTTPLFMKSCVPGAGLSITCLMSTRSPQGRHPQKKTQKPQERGGRPLVQGLRSSLESWGKRTAALITCPQSSSPYPFSLQSGDGFRKWKVASPHEKCQRPLEQ